MIVLAGSFLYSSVGKLDIVIRDARKAVQLAQEHFDGHDILAAAMNTMASALKVQSNFEESEELYRKSLA